MFTGDKTSTARHRVRDVSTDSIAEDTARRYVLSADITRESSPSLKLRCSVSSFVFEYVRHICVVFSNVSYLSPVVGVSLPLPVLISVEHSLVLRLLFASTRFLASEHDLFMDKYFGLFVLINTGLCEVISIRITPPDMFSVCRCYTRINI